MTIQGKVTAIHEEWITVEVGPRPECQGCKGCAGLFAPDQTSTKEVQALRGDFEPAIGTIVQLDTRPGEGSIAATLIFGFPMAGFFLGMFAGPSCAGFLGYSPAEWHAVAGGLIGIVLAFLLLYLVSLTGSFNRLCLKVVALGASPQSCSHNDQERTSA